MAKSEFICGLSYLADKLTFGVLVIARDRIIDYANPAAAELLNLTVSEIQGQSCQFVLGCCTPDGKNLCKEHCLCQLREEGLIKTGIVLKQTAKTKEIRTEISVGVYPFPAKPGVEQESLLVFDDIANLIKWDDMRGAFCPQYPMN